MKNVEFNMWGLLHFGKYVHSLWYIPSEVCTHVRRCAEMREQILDSTHSGKLSIYYCRWNVVELRMLIKLTDSHLFKNFHHDEQKTSV